MNRTNPPKQKKLLINLQEYYGFIEMSPVKNHRNPTTGTGEPTPPFIEMPDRNARFVHYPDCQQLLLRLPQYGDEYGDLRLLDEAERVILEAPVKDKLNGRTQILWDTLNIAPGNYRIEIDYKSGYQHEIAFVKYEAGAVTVKSDVTGPVHPPEPEIKPVRRIEYEGNLRAGNVIYIDGNINIRFDHEMGGGNCLVYIFIPEATYWEQKTGTPLADRDNILQFIAENVKRDQASGTRFEITDNQISFYYR